MMPLKPPTNHASAHITAKAKLQPQATRVRRDLPLDGVAEVDDVPDPVGAPLPQHHHQLRVGPARLGLGEVQRHAKPGGAAGGLERRLQGLDAAPERVPAQVDAYDAAGLEALG